MRIAALLALLVLLPGCFTFPGSGGGPRDYVSSSTYTKWVIEIDYATGKTPSSDLLSFLDRELEAVVSKPQGVELRLGESLPNADRTWSDGDVRAFARDHASQKTGGDTVVLHLLFLAGRHSDGNVLGVAYGHDLIAIFSDSVNSLCSGAIVPGTCSTAPFYRAVVLHELGHAMGLVNNGIDMVRDHEAKSCAENNPKGHSANQNSVMTCEVESASALGQLFGGNPPQAFDNDDRADLKAAGGK
ncbi:MAG: hypothetical protein AABX89_08480 [Candidatus Thermoplasmatota archaeon]